ncbi:hypothetical protein RE474_05745 [Methanolobus sediminis]|uniref:Uncharacterized protein n=1 Tax=Methanolobus sediminis TaxID=3072978 RepID=A0AA51UMB5_9EURY|nr:hypothetical protein [Methanolobus sediminis]WMW26214.1 hypothetical protein RE474_05745 [Methanolobus sediminis]
MLPFREDEKAVSISVGFVLTLSITVITMMVVISSFYTMMDRAEQTIMRDEFEIHGNDMALQLSNIDTAVQITRNAGGDVGSFYFKLSLPDEIAGQQYSMEISNQTNEIIFESHGKDATRVKVPYQVQEVEVASVKLFSGSNEFVLNYDPSSNMIEVY